MTLTAPSRLNRQRGFHRGHTTHLKQARSTAAKRTAPSTPATPNQVVLMVDFASPEGRAWWAVGLGDTFAEALAFARDSCPTDTTWEPTGWNDLYGD
ncbi:MAG: hypothetical protein ACTHQQ_14965 [Solirubrobacteraceae bacterium]